MFEIPEVKMFKIPEVKGAEKNELSSQKTYRVLKLLISNSELRCYVKSKFCLPTLLPLKVITFD